MSDTKHYDAIIIGSGQGASPMAKYLAGKGMQTALIERRYLGGTCVNTGCTPTKMLVGSAKAAHDARDTDRFGVHVSDVQVDFTKVMKRKDDMVIHSRENQHESLGNTKNLEIIYGDARFDDDKTLTVAPERGRQPNNYGRPHFHQHRSR